MINLLDISFVYYLGSGRLRLSWIALAFFGGTSFIKGPCWVWVKGQMDMIPLYLSPASQRSSYLMLMQLFQLNDFLTATFVMSVSV